MTRPMLAGCIAYVGLVATIAIGVMVASASAVSRRRNTPAPLRWVDCTNLPAGDPLDSLDPEERELFMEAWWQDVLAMPENELDEDEHAYLRWVNSLPEVVA